MQRRKNGEERDLSGEKPCPSDVLLVVAIKGKREIECHREKRQRKRELVAASFVRFLAPNLSLPLQAVAVAVETNAVAAMLAVVPERQRKK
ncbi:uncharacterized protein DS421_10g303550 [Arachis hypogaea]|nr:uncharacterized protein DS421_10g303550 [Arachis hypogaea]